MIVSTKGSYALRIMTELAGRSEPASLKELALKQGIPHKYSENIMTELAKAGLVLSSRGKAGGYRLARRPEEYTVAEILRVTETSITAVSCTDTCTEENETACPHAGVCPTLPMWRALEETVNEFFTRYTLADLLPKE